MGRHPILAAAGWLVATVAATLVGLGAIQLVGAGIIDTPAGVVDQGEVARALASPQPVPPGRSATPAPTPTAVAPSPSTSSGAPRGFAGPGGEHELRLRCVNGTPVLEADD